MQCIFAARNGTKLLLRAKAMSKHPQDELENWNPDYRDQMLNRAEELQLARTIEREMYGFSTNPRFAQPKSKITTRRFPPVINARTAIFFRDRGVCAVCRLDSAAFGEALAYVHRQTELLVFRLEFERFRRAIGVAAALWPRVWEMDHRIPVRLGGTNHPDNLRTLCIACHRIETKRLRECMRRGGGGWQPLPDGYFAQTSVQTHTNGL